VPAFGWLLTALQFALLSSYSLLYPAYLGWDEPQHVDMVVALSSGDGWQDPGTRILSTGVAATSDLVYGGRYTVRPYSDDRIAPRGARPSLREAGGDRPSAGHLPNQMVQHPPLYYAMGALVLRVMPGSQSWPYDRTVEVLRLLSVLLLTPLPLLAWAAARRLTDSTSVQKAAAAVPLAIPGLARVGGSVNNDNLLILAVAALTVALLRVATGDLTRRTGVYTGLIAALALLAKGFGLVLPVAVLAAYAVGWRQRRGPPPWQPAALALSVAGVLGGSWWLANLLRFGVLQPNGFGAAAQARIYPTLPPASAPRPVGRWWDGFYHGMVSRFWSGLGLPEPPQVPWPAIWAATVVLALGLLAGLLLGGWRRGRPIGNRLAMLVALLPTVLIFALVAAGSWGVYEHTLLLRAVQGRYLYPGVVGVAVVACAGLSRLLGPARPALPAVVLLGAGGLQLLALRAIVGDFWLPHTSGGRLGHADNALAAVERWSPVPAGVTVLTFLVLAGLGLAALVVSVVGAIPAGRRSASRGVRDPAHRPG